MRPVVCFLLACLMSAFASAQKVYFIYLQNENNSPFYLKMGDRIFASSNSGYLILSGLADSTHLFSIGMPSGTSEFKFSIPIKGKDHGFLIRTSPSMVLFDLQTHTTIRPRADESGKGISYKPRNDAFTSLLALAANDTTLLFVMETTPAAAVVYETKKPAKEEHPVQINNPEKATDTNISVSSGEASEEKKIENIDKGILIKDTVNLITEKKSEADPYIQPSTPEIKRSVVKKHSESSTFEGFGLVYYDITENNTDTIRLMIPNPKIEIKKTEAEEPGEMLVLNRDSLKKASSQTLPPCKVVATEADFFKLRKVMAAKTSDNAMVDEARKSFKSKCYTTEQVRHLSTLFLTSAGKFQFFESAYRHISDIEHFPTLAPEIRDDYYSKRFKTLAGD
jgi:hypothetical protein